MCIWILIAVVIIAIFYAQDLPNWIEKGKKEAMKAKNVVETKIKDIKKNKK